MARKRSAPRVIFGRSPSGPPEPGGSSSDSNARRMSRGGSGYMRSDSAAMYRMYFIDLKRRGGEEVRRGFRPSETALGWGDFRGGREFSNANVNTAAEGFQQRRPKARARWHSDGSGGVVR